MNSYYEGIQDACLKANAGNLEVVKCPPVLNSVTSWKVANGHIIYHGGKCLYHDTTSNSAAKLKPCDPKKGSDSFVSVIPYRSSPRSPYGPDPYEYDDPVLSNIFPKR